MYFFISWNNSKSGEWSWARAAIQKTYYDEPLGEPKSEEAFVEEAAKMPKYEEGGGTKIGYHSEAANISSHRKRLHDNKDSLTEQKVGNDDDNDVSDQ